jgi:mannitol-1-phosphate 5-dehydrogenase
MTDTASPSAVVFGAGKIARGFLGHILFRSGYRLVFVEVNPQLRDTLNRRGHYTVHILGAPELDSVVTPVVALDPADPRVTPALVAADLAFISVGGANLSAVAPVLAAGVVARLRAGATPFNVIVCENWRGAAALVRRAVAELVPDDLQASLATQIGIAESTVLRSAIAATAEQLARDPGAVQSQNWWTLPLDGDALVGALPPVEALDPVPGFANALERKLYTYNTANATISFLGWLRGHTLLAEAAHDPVILALVNQVYQEMGLAMVRKFGFDPEDQRQYAAGSLAKFRDRAIVDPITRQVADPLRKLGHDDRLVGAGLAALSQGVQPEGVAIAIAAALRYRNPDDPSAVRLGELIAQHGELAGLAEIAQLPADHPLIHLVAAARPALDALIAAPASPAGD